GSRTLGWDTAEDGATYGHTGYTGTSIWIDPVRGSWSVLLTNRVYEPRAENRIPALRRAVRHWVAVATEWSSLG
nr:serine hydrolase [Gemmatimonadota bacterium]